MSHGFVSIQNFFFPDASGVQQVGGMTAGGFGGTAQGGAVGEFGGGGVGSFGAAGGFGGSNAGLSSGYGGNVCPFGDRELGMESKNIQDSQITSSTARENLPPENGRLNGESSWSADQNDKNQWLQIDLGDILAITRIATQGRHDYDQWVESYLLSYSSDGETFENYRVDGTDKV